MTELLPELVKRYFATAVTGKAPPVLTARLRWRGEFCLGRWRPFSAKQIYQTAPPGFVWKARIGMVFVRDRFTNGEGGVHAALLGIVPVANVHGTPEIAAAALQRYLAEAVWFPTALTPQSGVRWETLDRSSARATLTASNVTVSLDFHFGLDSLIERIHAPVRFRDVDGTAVPTPWGATVNEYFEHDGFRIPRSGEAAWILPEGRQPYWRGQVVEIDYTRATVLSPV